VPLPRHILKFAADKIVVSREIASVSATTTVHLYKVPAGRKFRLERVLFINPTGLAIDPANAFKGEIKDSAVVMSTVFDTLTGDTGSASLPANTFVDAALIAANIGAIGNDVIDLVLTKTGTQTLPAGSLVIEGRLF
jgi:hypothetical protein